MQAHDDGTTYGDAAAILGHGLIGIMRGGRLTDRQKRALARRRDAIKARGRANKR